MYSPKAIFDFMISPGFHSIMNESFYKRHMESEDHKSPFDDPESIIFLEWFIDHNYIIAEYRGDDGSDNETYLISTLGHAFLRNYRLSRAFRFRAHFQFYKTLYWMLIASAIGSLIANGITWIFIEKALAFSRKKILYIVFSVTNTTPYVGYNSIKNKEKPALQSNREG